MRRSPSGAASGAACGLSGSGGGGGGGGDCQGRRACTDAVRVTTAAYGRDRRHVGHARARARHRA